MSDRSKPAAEQAPCAQGNNCIGGYGPGCCDFPRSAAEIAPHEHCDEGACESCDCCAAGWCVAFEDGDPYPQQFYGYSKPYSAALVARARDEFDLWVSMVLDAWEVARWQRSSGTTGGPAAQPRLSPDSTSGGSDS